MTFVNSLHTVGHFHGLTVIIRRDTNVALGEYFHRDFKVKTKSHERGFDSMLCFFPYLVALFTLPRAVNLAHA